MAQTPKKIADLIRPDAPAADARTALGLGDAATHAAADFMPAGGGGGTGGGSGTVTSVALAAPGVLYSVAGSPVTGSGTLTLALLTQAPNRVLAGPTSGADQPPTMRALVAADVPDLSATYATLAGAYANPAWITSLAGTKVTGTVPAATTAASLSGAITEAQVTGLAADLAARLQAANNLADLASPATSRTNLGLGAGNSPAFAGLTVGSLAGLVKGTAGVLAAATAGTDYLTPTGNGSGLTSLNASALATGTAPAGVLPVFGPSGGTHARGAVPDPGSVAGTGRFLREDGAWSTTSSPTFASGVGISAYPTPGASSTTIEAGGGPIVQMLNPLALVNLASVTDQDTAYVDLDLSAYVPPGAAVAWLYLAVQMAVADSTIKLQWRAKGDIAVWGATGSDGSLLIQPIVAGYYTATVVPIRLGPDRIVQYKRVNANSKSCIWRIWLMGWQ
jgi:hypothetical protein